MQIKLNAIDVFNAAILLEKRGADFYAAAAKQSEGEAENLLHQLAEMEQGHAKHFENLLAKISITGVDHSDDGKIQESSYLKALTSDRIITRETALHKDDDYGTILEKAMLIEKNSIVFYTGIKSVLSGRVPPSDVDLLIQEEMGHFRILNEALEKWLDAEKSK
jgi:rubrerythrin